VLRKIFESKREEVTGDWRKSHDEELQFFVLLSRYSYNCIKDSGMGRSCGTCGGRKKCTQILTGKNKG
jgi:hypothetical protein